MSVETVPFRVEPGAALRRSERREPRSLLEPLVRTALAIGLSAAFSVGSWQSLRWARTSPLFAISRVRFVGLQHAGEEELLRKSGLSLGQNLFQADLARASRSIEAHPWVASARLERRLPATVLASVVEHRPMALVQLGNLYVLDDQGQLFKRAAAEDALDLPLVTGLGRDEVARPETRLRLLLALQLVDAWNAQGLTSSSLSELRLEEDQVTLFARDGGASVQEIRLGRGDFPAKLRKLSQVRAALARRGERAARIDLDNQARPEWVTAQLTSPRE